MAIITPNLLRSLFTGYQSLFQKGLGMAPSQYQQIASVVPSSSASNTYGWLGQFPQFREWIGERVIKDMAAHGYQIFNKDFESTIGVDRNDIEDDNLGIYSPLFLEMGRAAAAQPDELTFGLLKKGFNELCFDGQNFFDTDHPVGQAGSEVSVSNFDDGGSSPKAPWFLLDTSRAIKPLIFQQRKKPKFVSMTKEEDELVFMNKQYRYGVDSRCNVGFGFWQMAYASQQELKTDAFDHAFDTMCSYTSDEGRPLGITPTTLVVPPQLRTKANAIVKEKLAGGEDNPNSGIVKVVVSPWLI
ncbi:Mu-like prophage major head subunit gpT family protein [Algicola sagamiensis]|uniref:Mu-like prophage major head subunit gpT family protein n=1 Tax=Algicola sagamiensis TaxID=163869 RepID=UPI0003708D73|nr:Mu-like prophage major head subunit gpT family protein [Algicola sagamiensis]